MAHAKVSSCVLSILSSFAGGLDVARKLRNKRAKRRRTKTDQQHRDEELRLSKSLRRGPEDIVKEYEKSLYAAGDGFAVGDPVAQSSLAGILLRLNTGLVGIIASFLDGGKKDARLDYPSLTDLSDRSREDTCRALRQLYKRMSQVHLAPAAAISRLALPGDAHSPSHVNTGHDERKPRRKPAVSKQTKIRGPTLARVVIQDSSKPSQIAMVKPGERRKRSHSASGLGSSNLSKAKPRASSVTTTTPALPSPPPPAYGVFEHLSRPVASRAQTFPAEMGTERVRREEFAAPPISNLPPQVCSTPQALEQARRQRKATPTYYSIATDSTKLGEIPLHKWPVPFDFDAMSLMNKEAETNGWPGNNGLDETGGDGKKKRFGLFRMFRKKEAVVG